MWMIMVWLSGRRDLGKHVSLREEMNSVTKRGEGRGVFDLAVVHREMGATASMKGQSSSSSMIVKTMHKMVKTFSVETCEEHVTILL